MAQLAVAAVGAMVGSATLGTGVVALGMTGAGIGWMVGSIVGSMLFAPDAPDGPRIADKKVQSSIYGQPIPIIYGTERVGAQVLWASDLIEHSEEVGGKGGGGVTVYSYSVNMLVSVCEGPRTPLRIWANGRLLWTKTTGVNGRVDEALIERGNVRIYTGTETQMPDPVYEAAVGTANAVAYRGQVVVMLEGLQLEFAGNRPPSIEVEVAESVVAASCPATVVDEYSLTGTQTETNNSAGFSEKYMLYFTLASAGTIDVWDVSGSAPTRIETIDVGAADYLYVNDARDELYVFSGTMMARYSLLTRAFLGNAAGAFGNHAGVYWDDYASVLVGWTGGAIFDNADFWDPITNNVTNATNVVLSRVALTEPCPGDPVVFVSVAPQFTPQIYVLRKSTSPQLPTLLGSVSGISGLGAGCKAMAYDSRRKRVIAAVGAYIVVLDPNAADPTVPESIIDLASIVEVAQSGFNNLRYDADLDLYLGLTEGPGELKNYTICIDSETLTLAAQQCAYGDYSDENVTSYLTRVAYLGGDRATIVGRSQTSFADDGLLRVYHLPDPAAAGEPVTLASIVSDLCTRSGLAAAQIDVTELTDLVAGFKLARQTSARQAIDSLRPAYFFDGVESGAKLVWRKRGGPPVATITEGELGARVWQATADGPEPAREIEHVDEMEAPRELSVSYIDAAANYDPGVQTARRQVGEANATASLEVPVVLTADEAMRVALGNLLHAHASKDPIKIKLTHAYAALEAADPIIVPLADGTQQRIRIESLVRARPLLEVEAVMEDGSIYSRVWGGVDRSQGPRQTAPSVLTDTVLALLDLPPLRDQDDELLVYVAMAGVQRDATWPGAVLYRSADGGSSYDVVLSTPAAGTIGVAISVLGDWAGGNRWDDTNTLDVLLTSGTFSSATELAVLNGANAVYVGGEIVQFVTAELIATNTWRLSGLLRGRIGTERAIAGHVAGERVVLLSALSLRMYEAPTLAEIGQRRHFKAVTGGTALADAAVQSFALAGNSLRPLSPVHIAGSRAGGDLTISWVRRARVNAAWMDGIDVPLDEPTEAYELDILDGATVVRTLTAATPTATYTAAQQTTDFGSPQASVAVRIYQISSRVGRGHAGDATV